MPAILQKESIMIKTKINSFLSNFAVYFHPFKHLGLWEINPAEVWSVKACPPSVWRARPPPKPTGKTQEYHLDYSHRGVRLLWAGGDEYILFPHDWQFSTSKWPRCSLPPHVTTPPPRSVLGLKGIPTTSWAAFFIDTQGKIAYTSTHKKGVLIHYAPF